MTSRSSSVQQPPLELNPARTAVIVVDMQNGFIRDKGFMNKIGRDNSRCKKTVGPICRLVEACRAAGVPVIFTRMMLRPDYRDAGLFPELFPAAKAAGAMIAGTYDAELIDELQPLEGEWVVDKTRYSAFYNTKLEVILRSLGVDTVIVTGVTTNICVESTVRDAFFRDYRVVVPTDATAASTREMEEGSLLTMGYGFGRLSSTDEVIQALKVRV